MTATTSRPLSESTDSLLRFAMRADAILTGLAGVAVAAVARWLSPVTGLSTATEYALAAFFIVYGVVVFGLAGLPSVRRAGIGVVIANLAFTVAAVVVVLAGWLPLTTAGVVMTLATGAYTLVFAELQYQGLLRMRA
ncbi:MAG: hypothetical protein ABWY20_03935 [Mycobacterium sp.]